MNPALVRSLDRIAGTPLCALLSVMESAGRFVPRPAYRPPARIVFVKLIEMGSTVLACPAFEEASRRVGKDNLFFLVFESNRAIADLLPYFHQRNVISVDDSSLPAFAAGLCSALRRIRREKIDAAVDMEGLTRASAAITYLTGCRIRAGYYNFTSEGPYRGRLFTHELNYGFQHHVSRQFLALTSALFERPGAVPMLKRNLQDAALAVPDFKPSRKELDEVAGTLERQAGSPVRGPKLLLNPNCSDLLPLRKWPEDRFVELGRRLLERFPEMTIVLTGSPSEQKRGEELAAAIGRPPRAFSMAGRTTMRQLLTLYCLSRLMVSNDSGPCHFASLTPISVIALYGPETPLLYAPLGDNVKCLTANLACSPCVNMLNHRFSPCNDGRCMAAITVDEVFNACVESLARTCASSPEPAGDQCPRGAAIQIDAQ